MPNQKDAQAQFDAALAKESAGDLNSALAGYHKTVHRFPKSEIASKAQYKAGTIYEKVGNLSAASGEYEKLPRWRPSCGSTPVTALGRAPIRLPASA